MSASSAATRAADRRRSRNTRRTTSIVIAAATASEITVRVAKRFMSRNPVVLRFGCLLTKFEFDRDLDDHVDRGSLSSRGGEPPLFHCLPCAIVEAAAEPPQELDVANRTVAPDDDFEQH